MSNWNFQKPLITDITNLTAFAVSNQIVINWVYPTDFTDITTHDPSNVIEYKLYRHIEIITPATSANGGVFTDASTYNTPFYSTVTHPEPIFKLIATLPSTTIQYVDTLNDLSLHNDEGISLINGRWVDTLGNDILTDIAETRRRLVYKLIAVSNTMIFNSLPFIYICHTNGIECRSTLTQVKWNTLYYEGDTIWFNPNIQNCNRTSIDLVFDIVTNRYLNVWVSGTGNTVYCLDGRNGRLIKSYTLPFTNILGLRVDPDTGDGIITGNNSNVYRCRLLTGTTSTVRGLNTPYAPNGNNGLVITKESNNHFASVIANMDTVAKCGLDTASTEVIPRTTFGCQTDTKKNIPNILGITNGPDTGVWVNGHTPIHYKYRETKTAQTVTKAWIPQCKGPPDGVPTPAAQAQWHIAYEAKLGYPPSYDASCDQDHYTLQTTVENITINVDVKFLQDIGYLFGATTGINKGISNGESYPYNNGTYRPFTAPTTQRTGWFGRSTSIGGDQFGRPYDTGSTSNPANSPNPCLSQKGLAADIPSLGLLNDNNYNIFQVNEFENKVHKLMWNGTTLNYNYITSSMVGIASQDYWTITKPVHIAIDSQSNVWVIQEGLANPELTIIYQTLSTNDFPNGGNCRWPIIPEIGNRFGITSSYVYGIPYNDAYIEYYLTRDISLSPSLTTNPTDGYRNGFGVCLQGDLGTQKVTAREWCTTGSNYNTIGKKLYTFYAGPSSTHSFPRYGGDTIEYNSDNLGLCYVFTEQAVDSYPEIFHPEEVLPQADLRIKKIESSPINCDSNFWNNQNRDNSPTFTIASGYDDFAVQLSATLISTGSFICNGYNFYYDDKVMDIGAGLNPTNIVTNDNVITYIYHDPSINGKPGERWTGNPAESTGMYNPYVRVNTSTNAYYVTGDDLRSNSPIVTAVVLERWPTARFYGTPFDRGDIRQTYFSSWHLTSFNLPVGDNGHALTMDTRIISGYDPLSAQFTDMSISRTWPLSAWYWDFGDNADFGGFSLDNSRFGITDQHTISQLVTTDNSNRDDCLSIRSNMVNHLYKGAGTYYATLWVEASNSNTSSWPISSGITDQDIMRRTFTMAASREVKVLEVCPHLLFSVISGETVESTYTDDNPLSSYSLILADRRYDGIWTESGLISGYAPYLYVSLVGYATTRSLPFSGLQWNWSDPYSDFNQADTTLYTYPTAGWPEWNNVTYTVSGGHLYEMPGLYDITLVPLVSSPNPNYVSNCSGLRKRLQVYVEEILPQANCYQDITDGASPLTITITPSTTIAGSFPICRLDWEFGDNTPIVSISRLMSGEYVNYYNASAFEDPSDPRNIVVSHTYTRITSTQPEYYTVQLSAFACNTNSVNIFNFTIGPVAQINLKRIEGDMHLIENRMYDSTDNLLLVFEGQTSKNTFTVLLST